MALMIDRQQIFNEFVEPLLLKAIEICDKNGIPYVFVAKVKDETEDEPDAYAIGWNPDDMPEEEDVLHPIIEVCKSHGLALNP